MKNNNKEIIAELIVMVWSMYDELVNFGENTCADYWKKEIPLIYIYIPFFFVSINKEIHESNKIYYKP